jgi:hypothetical protein
MLRRDTAAQDEAMEWGLEIISVWEVARNIALDQVATELQEASCSAQEWIFRNAM